MENKDKIKKLKNKIKQLKKKIVEIEEEYAEHINAADYADTLICDIEKEIVDKQIKLLKLTEK